MQPKTRAGEPGTPGAAGAIADCARQSSRVGRTSMRFRDEAKGALGEAPDMSGGSEPPSPKDIPAGRDRSWCTGTGSDGVAGSLGRPRGVVAHRAPGVRRPRGGAADRTSAGTRCLASTRPAGARPGGNAAEATRWVLIDPVGQRVRRFSRRSGRARATRTPHRLWPRPGYVDASRGICAMTTAHAWTRNGPTDAAHYEHENVGPANPLPRC